MKSLLLAFLMGFMLLTATTQAAPSQDDVFKSIQDSMGKPQEFDYRPVLLLAAGGGLVVLLLAVSSRRQQSGRSSQPVNSAARLMKQILREIPLKPGEVKQLKVLAGAVKNPTVDQTNPLVLLLCPSVMAKGLQTAGNKIDRKTVAQIVRKLREGA
jgi:hypothetical protein